MSVSPNLHTFRRPDAASIRRSPSGKRSSGRCRLSVDLVDHRAGAARALSFMERAGPFRILLEYGDRRPGRRTVANRNRVQFSARPATPRSLLRTLPRDTCRWRPPDVINARLARGSNPGISHSAPGRARSQPAWYRAVIAGPNDLLRQPEPPRLSRCGSTSIPIRNP